MKDSQACDRSNHINNGYIDENIENSVYHIY